MSRRLKIGCGVVVLLTAAGIIVPLRMIKSRIVEVDVEAVKRADIDQTVSAVPVAQQPAGMVKPDEVKVIPKVGGELLQLLVEEGDTVHAGQVIAYLDSRSLDADLRQAQETATAARARAEQVATDVRVAPTRAETAVEEARAAAEQAQAQYKTALRGARAEEIDRAREAVEQAEQDVTEADANLATVTRGARPEEIASAGSALDQASAQADSARANLDLLQAGPRPEEVSQAEFALGEAESQLALREQELASQQQLAEGGFVAANALKAAQTARDAALAARDTARERLALARQPHRPEEIRQAEAALRQARAAVERSQHDLDLMRTRSTPEDLASAQARRDAARSRLNSARAQLRLTETQTTPEDLATAAANVRKSKASARRTEAERVSVRQRELDLEMLEADWRRAEAALEQAAERAGYTIITAPIDGLVTRINSKKGEYVQGGAVPLPSAEIAMLVITDTDHTWVECNIDEADIYDVRVGQKAAIDLGEGRQMTGRVAQISPSIRLVQGDVRTFAVKLTVEGDASSLRSGASVYVDIITKSTHDVVSVPSFSVSEDKEGKFFVYVLEEGKAKKREVTKGVEGIERTEITKGLKEGEQIITSLEAKGLRDGKKVKVRKPDDDTKPKPDDLKGEVQVEFDD
jgi:RND family efflux transporter MFP subunit